MRIVGFELADDDHDHGSLIHLDHGHDGGVDHHDHRSGSEL
jgi:hypothetical protein